MLKRSSVVEWLRRGRLYAYSRKGRAHLLWMPGGFVVSIATA